MLCCQNWFDHVYMSIRASREGECVPMLVSFTTTLMTLGQVWDSWNKYSRNEDILAPLLLPEIDLE